MILSFSIFNHTTNDIISLLTFPKALFQPMCKLGQIFWQKIQVGSQKKREFYTVYKIIHRTKCISRSEQVTYKVKNGQNKSCGISKEMIFMLNTNPESNLKCKVNAINKFLL